MTREEKQISLLQSEWEHIFASCNPFGNPFTHNISSYMLLYPTEGYHLAESQYFALTKASKASGDAGFWISETEWQTIKFPAASHWWCSFPTYNEYEQLPLVLENSIYSPRSQWGILLSHEDHAIVGGSVHFIELIKEFYPNWRADPEALRAVWSKHQQSDWLQFIIPLLMI